MIFLVNGPRGAEAPCTIYSIIETAKHNGLEPFAYLNCVLFTTVPTISTDDEWDERLPPRLDPATLEVALPTAMK